VIEVLDQDGIAVVRIQHGKVNALDLELLQAITVTMSEVADAAAVVLTGSGRAFSAGVDLRRIVDGGAAYVQEFLPALSEAFLAVFDCPRPVVAAINGHAIAGGCVIAAACDVRTMCAGTIGLTGRTLDTEQARSIGLVDEVIAPETLMTRAAELAQTLSRVSPDAYALTKHQLHRPARLRIAEHQPADDEAVTRQWSSPRTMDAIAAYLTALEERRPPPAAG
jgi:enoyl-CoA hydratase